jgi:hypothetical protein
MNDKDLIEYALATVKSLEASGRRLVVLAEAMAKRLNNAGDLPTGIEWLSIQEACTRQGHFRPHVLRWGLENNRWPLTEGVHYSVARGGKNRRIRVAYPSIFEAIGENA